MKETFLIKAKDVKYIDLLCGECKSVIYGYDEQICPTCGAYIDTDDEREMTKEEIGL